MIESQAVVLFAALAQESRLRAVRALVQAGPEGLSAGRLAETLGVSPSNLSFHLKELERAGLVTAQRRGTSMPRAFSTAKTHATLLHIGET